MGEGLDALLGLTSDERTGLKPRIVDPAAPVPPMRTGQLIELSIDVIAPNEFQPRARFDDGELEALADSVRAVGVLQPILVRRIDDYRYELIAGERRWRAAQRAGLRQIPAIVREAEDQESLEQAVVENLHRADLNPLEEAAAYRQLIDDFGLRQDEVARRVGKSRSAIANCLRLFQLPSSLQRLISSGELSAGHARALLAYPERQFQEALAARIVREGLSVRQVEDLVRTASRQGAGAGRPDPASSRPKPASLLEIERLLSDRLDTRVEVSIRRDRGRMVVEFADLEDLDRIFRLLS